MSLEEAPVPLLQAEEESTDAWVLWQRDNHQHVSSASMPTEDKMVNLCELTFSPFGPGGPIGPGGPVCPCGEQTACELTGKSCLMEGPSWFPDRTHVLCVGRTHGSWRR